MRLRTVTADLSADAILQAADRYRGNIFVLDDALQVRAAALAQARRDFERKLSRSGIAAGDRVVLATANGPGFVAGLTTLLTLGASPLLLHAKTPLDEIARTALRYGARFVVSDAFGGNDAHVALSTFQDVSPAAWMPAHCAAVDEHDPAFRGGYPSLPGVPLHPTSGTTNLPKIAVRPGHAAVAEAEHYIATIGIGAGDTILAVPPMSHAYAYGICVMVPLVSGANIVASRQFQAGQLQRAIKDRRITIFPSVPGMLDVLLFGMGNMLNGSLRCVLSAGAPLSRRTALAFHAKFGICVRPLYGTTETGGISVAPPTKDPSVDNGVGPAMNGIETHIPSASADDDASHGDAQDTGTLHVRSASMMGGYLSEDGIDDAMISDGWFDTGDLAHQDEWGQIHLRGRLTEVINVEGMKVVPCEVEEVIAALPGVRDVKVYAGKLPSGSCFVKAAVVPEGALDESAIKAHCEKHLVYYKRPTRFLLVDALPKTPSGKVVLQQLP